MIRFEIKNSNMTLAEKLQKYKHYHPVKLVNMRILEGERYYFLIKVK